MVQRQRVSEIRNEPDQAGGAFDAEEVGGVHRGPVEKHWENAVLSRGHAAARVGDDRMKCRAICLSFCFQMDIQCGGVSVENFVNVFFSRASAQQAGWRCFLVGWK